MSLTRRLAAGLPAAGVTAFAALAFAGTPAMAATADAASTAVRPALMATPCTDAPRADCTYSTAGAPVPGVITTSPSSDDNGAGQGSGSGYGAGTGNGTGAGYGTGTGNGGHRGQPGYGGVSPTISPSASTPTGDTDTVPPGGGVSPTTASPATPPGGGGVSPAGTLPLTGAPMGATVAFGVLLLAAGAGAVWYSRRRRSA